MTEVFALIILLAVLFATFYYRWVSEIEKTWTVDPEDTKFDSDLDAP